MLHSAFSIEVDEFLPDKLENISSTLYMYVNGMSFKIDKNNQTVLQKHHYSSLKWKLTTSFRKYKYMKNQTFTVSRGSILGRAQGL